ncbi:TetR/AcrR family transcriptional regulator [Labrenzia sp. 011]|uniref:TetR/AcrR family transcriptional regulator n=1 Tax=Labrenzia sp. 011 TaxID=2171494 RepID=UPI000D507648|nr:TetR/AcrR family transcriptional regulator [Labrenzia sp. 011]PVB61182.1 TetR/AcrR family transcriptional regulator [Labrenzia sp. 011]
MTRAQPYDREKALDAAQDLFWRKGYHATSLKDLEAALAMKPGSIYAAFKSKEALYLASLERYFLGSRQALRDQMAGAATVLGALADHLRSYGDTTGAPPHGRACMIVKTLLDTTADDGAISDRAQIYFEALRDEFAGFFRQARDNGELPPDANPDRLARRYQANITALRVEAHLGGDPAGLKDLAENMAQEVEELGNGG